ARRPWRACENYRIQQVRRKETASSQYEQEMNDKAAPNPRDALVSKLLTRSAILEKLLIESVPEILKASDVPKGVGAVVVQSVVPAFRLQQEVEKEVVSVILAVPSAKLIGEAFDAMTDRMTRFAEEFSAVASTPVQMKLVAEMRGYVEMARG